MSGPQLLFSFLVGGVAGSLYFSGLWYTLHWLPTARRPALLLIGSFLLRLTLLLGILSLLAGSHWSSLLSALAGFLLVRTLLVRRWGSGSGNR